MTALVTALVTADATAHPTRRATDRHRCSARRPLVTRLAAGLLALVVLVLSTMPTAGAQPSPTTTAPPTSGVTLEVESVSPWVAADGTWTARLRVRGAPDGTRLASTIHQAPTGTESEVRSTWIAVRGGDPTRVLRSIPAVELSSLTDAEGLTTVSIPVRAGSGSRDRVRIPDAGTYPIVLDLTSPAGGELASTTLSLNRLPSESRQPLDLGVVLPMPAFDSFDDTGRSDVTPALRAAVSNLADRLEALGKEPSRVALHAESLVALDASTLPSDHQLLTRLADAASTTTFTSIGWGDLHMEAWARADATSDVQASVNDGQEATFIQTKRPVDTRVWPIDPTVGPDAVQLLARLGVTAVIVDPDHLRAAKIPTGDTGFTRPFRVTGSGSTSVAGLAVDPELEELLDAGGAHPVVAAHLLVTQLLAAWLVDDRPRGAVVTAESTVDPKVLRALRDALASGDSESPAPIRLADPLAATELAPTTTKNRDTPWSRAMAAPSGVPDVAGLARRLRAVRPLLEDYVAIMPNNDEKSAQYTAVVRRAVDRSLEPAPTEASVRTVEAAMSEDLAKVKAPAPRSIWVTSRTASVPLRFTNDTGRAIRVRLRVQSPRLTFVDGAEQPLTLTPGVNRVTVDVEVRASGQFTMKAELLAPHSDRVLASTRQRIRSRAFSGVGLMLSGGALLFLVIWWTRTLRKRREPDPPATDQ